MPNVVTYCRVSSDEQAEKDNSIPAQRKALHAWVNQNDGFQIVGEYVDEGISAYAPAERRPGFCEMVAYCRKHAVDAILVHKLDRFSRNREESILFKGLLRKHGVQVKSITENFDPDSPQGFLYEGMIEVINQFYSMNLATETLKGMRENASRGWVNGGPPPYGYRRREVVDDAGRSHFTYELGPPDEVEIVRDIFRMATLEGKGGRGIAESLNDRGVAAPGGGKWKSSGVHNVLNNQTYVGDLVWFKSKKHGRTGRATTEDGERIIVPDAFPAIIDRETFSERRDGAAKRCFAAHTSPHKHVTYLLGRLITCGGCGGTFVGRRREYLANNGERKTSLSYYCSGYLFSGAGVCASLPLDMAWLDGVVVDAISARFLDAAGWADLQRRVEDRIGARRRKYGAESKAAEAKRADIARRIQNVYRAVADGMDTAQCKQMIAELEAKRAEIDQEVKVLAQEDYFRAAIEKNLRTLEAFRGRLAQGFDTLPFGVQRQVITTFVSGIEVRDRRRVVVNLRVPLNNTGLVHLTDELSDEGEAEKRVGQGAAEGSNDERGGTHKRPPPLGQPGTKWLRQLDSNQ